MIKSGISYIDLAIVIILVFFLFKGYKRGFLDELRLTIGTLVSLFAAIRYMSDLSRLILGAIDIYPIIAVVISFTVIFVGGTYVFKFITDKLKKIINVTVPLGGTINNVIGAAFGLAKGAIIISLITILLSFVNIFDFSKRHITESQLFEPMQQIAPLVYETIKVLVPRSKTFLTEFEENYSGVSMNKREKATDNFIESLRKYD